MDRLLGGLREICVSLAVALRKSHLVNKSIRRYPARTRHERRKEQGHRGLGSCSVGAAAPFLCVSGSEAERFVSLLPMVFFSVKHAK